MVRPKAAPSHGTHARQGTVEPGHPAQTMALVQATLKYALKITTPHRSALSAAALLGGVGRLQNDFRFDVLYRAITGLTVSNYRGGGNQGNRTYSA